MVWERKKMALYIAITVGRSSSYSAPATAVGFPFFGHQPRALTRINSPALLGSLPRGFASLS